VFKNSQGIESCNSCTSCFCSPYVPYYNSQNTFLRTKKPQKASCSDFLSAKNPPRSDFKRNTKNEIRKPVSDDFAILSDIINDFRL
jgi:hypothetical protein